MIMIRPIRNRYHHSSQFTVPSRTLQTFSKKSPLKLAPLSLIAPFYCNSHKSSTTRKSRFYVKCIAWLVPIKRGITAFTK